MGSDAPGSATTALVAEEPAAASADFRCELEEIIGRVQAYYPAVDADPLRRAFEVALAAHDGQPRDSGEPYIVHPLAVVRILAGLQMDLDTLVAGMLHDVVEDTSLGLEQVRAQFGDGVAELVDGVTKLAKAQFEPPKQEDEAAAPPPDEPAEQALRRRKAVQAELKRRAENLRKIFLAMARDVRVMIIKLADRLHNMQTLGALPPEKRQRIALETLQIFAPLAHRLGIWQFKWQLEDLAFKYGYPKDYAELSERVARTRSERENDIAEVVGILRDRLAKAGIEAEIQGRPKHLWSIYNKIQTQRIDFNEIYDLIAVRIIVHTVAQCYHALGIVHDLWLPITGLFSDHIARPKSNLYQSLHTKVLGPRGEPLEIQIRTWDMHRTADFGVAAHWQYKEGGRPDQRFERKLGWLRNQLLDWNADHRDSNEFLRNIADDLFADQVFVFTPKGDVIDLPTGSTPIDFAFRIHSDVGLHVIGARVNGRMVPLSYHLKNGDIVAVMTRQSAVPSLDWLKHVKSSHARSRIKAWFRRQRHTENIQRGRELLEQEAERQGLEPREIFKPDRMDEVARQLNYAKEEDLLAAVGHGHLGPGTVVTKLRPPEKPKDEIVTTRASGTGKLSLTAGGVDDVYFRRSRCCSPLPGDEIIGHISRGRGMAIHVRECPNVAGLIEKEPDRVVPVEWGAPPGDPSSAPKYDVRIHLETLDRLGLLQDITSVFSERRVNILSVNTKSLANKVALLNLTVEVCSRGHLEELFRVLQSTVPDVVAAYRVGIGSGNGATALAKG